MVKRLSSTNQDSNKITNLPDPVDDGDAANKKYVDDNSGSSYAFSNGLTEDSGEVKLGGSLIEQTDIVSIPDDVTGEYPGLTVKTSEFASGIFLDDSGKDQYLIDLKQGAIATGHTTQLDPDNGIFVGESSVISAGSMSTVNVDTINNNSTLIGFNALPGTGSAKVLSTDPFTGEGIEISAADKSSAKAIKNPLSSPEPFMAEDDDDIITKKYLDNAVAPKANTSDLGTAAFEDVEDLPVSTATQSALDGKANATDTVNLTGNQTIAGVKTFSSSPVVPTATTNTQAVNKAQMDAADALKVNKAGDTMTGQLIAKDGLTVGVQSTYGIATGNVGIGGQTGVGGADGHIQSFSNKPLRLNSAGNPVYISEVGYLVGTGFPNGVVSAPVGSTYIDTAATNGAIEWKKAAGTGNTGWVMSVRNTGPAYSVSVSSTTSASSVTPNVNNYDMYAYTALAVNLTVNLPTGAADGKKLMFRIKDNGTSRTLTWNSVFRGIGVTIPTSTVAGKVVYVGAIYNSAETKWDIIAVSQEA